MPRYRLTLEYDGTPFVGWQRQDNGPSVQQAVEEAVAAYCGESVTLNAAGRTDAGVHALGQVAHVDMARTDPAEKVMAAVNAHLRRVPVAVVACAEVPYTFHARFSAVERSYVYRIVNRRAPLALDAGKAWWLPRPLETQAMNEAAQVLVGHHDFSTFRAVACQAKSPVKTLDELTVRRRGEHIEIYARARSFLHHQVRNLVGTLVQVGEGRWTVERVREALEARDRTKGGPTAPACGLYFFHVAYAEDAPQ